MNKKSFSFKKDQFKSNRGTWSRIMNIYCRKCENHLLVYQKDGPGNLRRMYMDRIYDPPKLVDLQNKALKDVPDLKCSKCGEVIATPYIYEKEKRKAFKVYQDAVVKKIRKSTLSS